MKKFTVLAPRPLQDYEPPTPRRWMAVGIATEQEDGNVLIRVNAVPLHWGGELKLVPPLKKSNQDQDPQ